MKKKRKNFSPREQKKKRVVKISSINFLTKKKTVVDKFSDIQKKYIKRSYRENKDGEFEFSKRAFYNELKTGLGITSTKQLKKYLAGNFTDAFRKKINRLHQQGRNEDLTTFDLTKKETKEFSPHTFTFSNFFTVRNRRIKKSELVTFNVGLNVFFKSKDSKNFIKRDGKYIQVYEATDVPVPHVVKHPKDLREAMQEMFDVIGEFIDRYKDRDSHILFFHFTRFIVNIAEL